MACFLLDAARRALSLYGGSGLEPQFTLKYRQTLVFIIV